MLEERPDFTTDDIWRALLHRRQKLIEAGLIDPHGDYPQPVGNPVDAPDAHSLLSENRASASRLDTRPGVQPPTETCPGEPPLPPSSATALATGGRQPRIPTQREPTPLSRVARARRHESERRAFALMARTLDVLVLWREEREVTS